MWFRASAYFRVLFIVFLVWGKPAKTPNYTNLKLPTKRRLAKWRRKLPQPTKWRGKRSAAETTGITSTTGIALIGPAPDFSGYVRYRWSRHKFLPALAGESLRRDHRYHTKPEKPGSGPISTIPVVEVMSVVLSAAEKRRGNHIK